VSDLGEDLARAYEARVAAADVELTPAAIRAVVRELGGGEGRAQVAPGTRALAGELGVAVRTVQRWQKEGGEVRNVARSTPGLRISVRGIATEVQRGERAGLPGAGVSATFDDAAGEPQWRLVSGSVARVTTRSLTRLKFVTQGSPAASFDLHNLAALRCTNRLGLPSAARTLFDAQERPLPGKIKALEVV